MCAPDATRAALGNVGGDSQRLDLRGGSRLPLTQPSWPIQSLFDTPAEPRRLRDYQQRAIDALCSALQRGDRRIVLQLPTGGGKTLVAAGIIKRVLAKGNRVIFVVPRISLIEQTVTAFKHEGISHIGVIQGLHWRTDSSALVQVASAQTLARRQTPVASLVIVDECHIQFDTIRKWMDEWQNIPFVGLSATPWSKGLGKPYRDLIQPVSICDLIDHGFLCPIRVFAPPGPDLKSVRTTVGDFNESDLSGVCDRNEIVADVITTWLAKGENRPTLVYGIDRKHARHLQERFVEAGVCAEYVDCDTALFEREEIFGRFKAGEVKVICNVATLDTGIDLDIRCIVDARPTKSRIRFVQTIGRGLRSAEGKEQLLVLDHAGNHHRLGLVTNIFSDVLDDGKHAKSVEREPVSREPRVSTCHECHCVLPQRARECPDCGTRLYAVTLVRERPGELVELGSNERGGKPAIDKALWHGALARYARRKGYQPGWAAYKYRKKFGQWPPTRDPVEREPTIEILNWIRSRQIAYARARRHA